MFVYGFEIVLSSFRGILQLSNQQQVHSWNVLEKLTNKVVYDFKNKKYVAVFFNRFFRLWDSSVTDVNKVKKLKVKFD